MDFIRVAETIGKEGFIELGGLTIKVTVLNYKQSYGKDRWLVVPIRGEGQIWVESVDVEKK